MSSYVRAHITVIPKSIKCIVFRLYAFGAAIKASLAKPCVRLWVAVKNSATLRQPKYFAFVERDAIKPILPIEIIHPRCKPTSRIPNEVGL